MAERRREVGPVGSLVDVFLPSDWDAAFEALAFTTFIDAGVEVPLSPVDQLAMSFTRRLLEDRSLGGVGVIQLPRARHRAALLLAITSHLLCRQPPARHHAPVVLIGFDVDLAGQLRYLSVQNIRRIGLNAGNPLAAHRLRRDGDLDPLVGSNRGLPESSLVYFNTRVGRPPFPCSGSLVILDATSVQYPDTRARAIEWALETDASAIIAVGDLGDDNVIDSMRACGVVPTVVCLDPWLADELIDTVGRGHLADSLLSSASLLRRETPPVHVHVVEDEAANEYVNAAFATLAAKPEGRVPPQLDLALNMLRNGTRLAATVSDYRRACTYNARPGETPMLRRLENTRPDLPSAWRTWGTARLGALHVAVRNLWRVLETDNPKLRMLWRVLARLDAHGTDRIVIRCHSRAAAAATRASLADGTDRNDEQIALWERLEDRVVFTTFKERFLPGAFDAQVLVAAPPPWQFSLLVGAEASESHVIAYDFEAATLRRNGERWSVGTTGWQKAACRTFQAAEPPNTASPIPESLAAAAVVSAAISVPSLSFDAVLDLASQVLDPEETDPSASAGLTASAGSQMRECVPVRLDNGRTWWCENEDDGKTPVLTLEIDGGYAYRPVNSLTPGDRIVVPAGEGTDSIHARLVAASRTNDEVRSLDVILSQFRRAARALIEQHGTREATEMLTRRGLNAQTQLRAWASGTTIAPREPQDVQVVFETVGWPCPNLGLVYAVAETLRGLSRTIGKFIAAIAGTGSNDALDTLRSIVGPVADEIVDEFTVVTVAQVDPAASVPARFAGRIR